MTSSPKTVFVDGNGTAWLRQLNGNHLLCPWITPYLRLIETKFNGTQQEFVQPFCGSGCQHCHFNADEKTLTTTCGSEAVVHPLDEIKKELSIAN